MNNQSELEQKIKNALIDYGYALTVSGGELQPIIDGLAVYITANYTANEAVKRKVIEARVEELTHLLSMQKNKPRRVLLKDAVNIAYSRVCELSDVKNLHKEQSNDQL